MVVIGQMSTVSTQLRGVILFSAPHTLLKGGLTADQHRGVAALERRRPVVADPTRLRLWRFVRSHGAAEPQSVTPG
jgi:hypothetical protein